MSFNEFPQSVDGLEIQLWETYEPFYNDLLDRQLSNGDLRPWLDDWSALSSLVWEAGALIYIKKSLDTADEAAEQAFLDFVTDVQPQASVADQALKERFLDSEPDGQDFADLALTIREMRNQADLFRDENVPLQTELAKLANEYDKITGCLLYTS